MLLPLLLFNVRELSFRLEYWDMLGDAVPRAVALCYESLFRI